MSVHKTEIENQTLNENEIELENILDYIEDNEKQQWGFYYSS